MPDIPVSGEEHLALERRHRAFKAGTPVERDGIRDFILDSWLRCRERSRRDRPKFHILPEKELEERRQRCSVILTHAAPVMHSVFELLNGPEKGIKGVKCCVFVTDRDGVLLAGLNNHPFPFRPGLVCSEELLGTNSVQSCIENRYISTVYGFEHYFEDFSGQVSSAAPIITEDGVVHGAFGVLLHCGDYDFSIKAMSDIAAKAVSSSVNAGIHRSYREFLLDHIDDAIIYIDKELRVLSFNRVAAENFTDLREGAELLELIPFAPDFGERLDRDLTDFFTVLRGRPRKGTAFYATVSHDHLGGAVIILRRARRVRELAARVATPGALYRFEDIMGESPALRGTIELARKASAGDMTTLVTGESGTGKELFAHAIHNAGARAKCPFLIVNCGALPQGLIQSELFGYEEGTFTGASLRGKVGKFELADGGTIFLDEVGELPLDVQDNLMRFLQSGELSKIGSARPHRVDVRVIAATNRDLPELIRQGRFRQDLFWRLNGFPLRIPALRERGDDVILLARHSRACFPPRPGAGNFLSRQNLSAILQRTTGRAMCVSWKTAFVFTSILRMETSSAFLRCMRPGKPLPASRGALPGAGALSREGLLSRRWKAIREISAERRPFSASRSAPCTARSKSTISCPEGRNSLSFRPTRPSGTGKSDRWLPVWLRSQGRACTVF